MEKEKNNATSCVPKDFLKNVYGISEEDVLKHQKKAQELYNNVMSKRKVDIVKISEEKPRITIDGLVKPEHLERFEEFKKASDKKTKIAVFIWMLENLRL